MGMMWGHPITGDMAYRLDQLQEPGFFFDDPYGNRTGVDHTFEFGHSGKTLENVLADEVFGFTFAHDFLERLHEDGRQLVPDALRQVVVLLPTTTLLASVLVSFWN